MAMVQMTGCQGRAWGPRLRTTRVGGSGTPDACGLHLRLRRRPAAAPAFTRFVATIALGSTVARAQLGICNATMWETASSWCPLANLSFQCTYSCAPGLGVVAANNATPSVMCTEHGWVEVAGSPRCTKCPAGTYQIGGGLSCSMCEPGSEPVEDAGRCARCNSSSASDGSLCIQCREWQTPNEDRSECDACKWAQDNDVQLCDPVHGSHCQSVSVSSTCSAQRRDSSQADGGPCAGYRCTPCPVGYTGVGYGQDFAHWDAPGSHSGSPVSNLVRGSCTETDCGCTDINECSPSYSPPPDLLTWPNMSVCHRFATCKNFDGGRNCTCNTGTNDQLTVRQQGPITAGTLDLFSPCVPNGTAGKDICGRNQSSAVGFNSCTNTSCKRLPGSKWTITDGMLRDGNLVPASKFRVASLVDRSGDTQFDWIEVLREAFPTGNYFSDVTPVDDMATGFYHDFWNTNGTCEDVNECIEVDPIRNVRRPSQVCSKLFPRGLYPNRALLEQLKKDKVKELQDVLGAVCNSTYDPYLKSHFCCGAACEHGNILDELSSQLSSFDLGQAVESLGTLVNGDSQLLRAPYCVNTIGSFACCMDYKDAAANQELRDGYGFPFTGPGEHWYPPVCKAIDWCNESISRNCGDGCGNLWEADQVGGCDPNTKCIPLPPPDNDNPSKQDWSGVGCTPCPADDSFTTSWRGRSDCFGHPTCKETPTEPAKEEWERACKVASISKENRQIMRFGFLFFFLVCCCGMCRTNRSLQVELSEARQHEVQKLVLENFEDHTRKAGCISNEETEETLEFNVETLANPLLAVRVGRTKLRNLTRLGRNVTERGYGMVESVTSSVVEHVPGGNYAREKLTEGLDRLEDATGNVVDVVPGANLGRQILSEAADMVPGRQFLPGRLGNRRVLPINTRLL